MNKCIGYRLIMHIFFFNFIDLELKTGKLHNNEKLKLKYDRYIIENKFI